MSLDVPKSLEEVVRVFSSLPKIGIKSARRIAYHLLKSNEETSKRIVNALNTMHTSLQFCSKCGAITEEAICGICADSTRDASIICVVEQPQDIFLFEQTKSFNGIYHVLGGLIIPTEGIGPDDLHISTLVEKVKNDVHEVIIATNPSHNGEMTALYIKGLLTPMGVRITRLGTGLPSGADIEYTDLTTLKRSLEGRRPLE